MAFEQMLNMDSADLSLKGVTASSARSRPTSLRAARPVFTVGRTTIRIIDLVLASLALAFISPVMLIIAALCRLADGGPALFAQSRCGHGGKMFKCLKFRSMVVDADVRLARLLATDPVAAAEWTSTHKLGKDPRITSIGGFLRKSSLDELPQLINVIRGEMSLVGPRPIVAAETSRYGRYMSEYNSVLPGITGMWQVSGRSDTNYRRRVALDVLYVRKRSLSLYVYILLMTIPAVLLRKGAC